MSDVAEITMLVHSYARLLDRGDTDAVVALFEHSTWRSEASATVLRGSNEVRPIYQRLRDPDRPRTKHLITNLTVDVEPGATAASSHCYWTVLQSVVPSQSIEVALSGQYVDAFSKVGGTWRFADRLITVDLGGDVSSGA
jgi:hypothetical protein